MMSQVPCRAAAAATARAAPEARRRRPSGLARGRSPRLPCPAVRPSSCGARRAGGRATGSPGRAPRPRLARRLRDHGLAEHVVERDRPRGVVEIEREVGERSGAEERLHRCRRAELVRRADPIREVAASAASTSSPAPPRVVSASTTWIHPRPGLCLESLVPGEQPVDVARGVDQAAWTSGRSSRGLVQETADAVGAGRRRSQEGAEQRPERQDRSPGRRTSIPAPAHQGSGTIGPPYNPGSRHRDAAP